MILNGLLLLAVLGTRWAIEAESGVVVRRDFLRSLDLPFRGWTTSDSKLTVDELDLLQPDSYIMRQYKSPEGMSLDLAVIAGSRKRSVHTPGYCMPGGGWESLGQETITLKLPGKSVTATRSVMTNTKGYGLLATYFFTDGDYATNSLVRFQARQLLKRFRHQLPLGALVRVLVPLNGDVAAAAKLTDEFCQATLPQTLALLREAGSGSTVAGGSPTRVADRSPARS